MNFRCFSMTAYFKVFCILFCKKPSRVIAWFRTTKAELKKISWTSKKTLLKNTTIALVGMIALGAVIALLDYVFNTAIGALSLIF